MNIKTQPSKKEIKSHSLRLIFGLPFLGFIWMVIVKWLNDPNEWNFYILGIVGGTGVSLGCLSFVSKAFGHCTWKAWHCLILIIDKFIIWTLLPVYFYLVFSPYALLLRLLGKSGLKKFEPTRKSYWTDVEQANSHKRYLQQF